MPELKKTKGPIPIIDLFAGPGGLGEGFSSVLEKGSRVFDIKLSIEKDENAHRTLELRSFTRQFPQGKLPSEYYSLLKEPNLAKRELLRKKLFERYPEHARHARQEAWMAELGSEKFPSKLVDERIKKELKGAKNWVLIGGPPCQAYSLVGRNRIGGIFEEDHRVHLYKQYLRIIAAHHPAVFVMENVKGLLSAKLGEDKIFDRILQDLRDPASVFPGLAAPKYRIYSLAAPPVSTDEIGNPVYKKDRDFLIQAERYGVPQKRHRVILLGIREDINTQPDILQQQGKEVSLEQVIGDLPKVRSGINRAFESSEIRNGKKKRTYVDVPDSDQAWSSLVDNFRKDIISWNGFAKNYADKNVVVPPQGTGKEFVPCNTPAKENPLYDWYNDPRLGGACNHESRGHLLQDLKRYLFSSIFTRTYGRFPKLHEYNQHSKALLPDHENAESGKFADRFRTQPGNQPATTVTCHISKDGHYFIHYDPDQCRSWTVREAARIQTFPDNYLFCGARTSQFHQVGNAVPPYLAKQIGEIVLKIMDRN